jgi:hypothetical protein
MIRRRRKSDKYSFPSMLPPPALTRKKKKEKRTESTFTFFREQLERSQIHHYHMCVCVCVVWWWGGVAVGVCGCIFRFTAGFLSSHCCLPSGNSVSRKKGFLSPRISLKIFLRHSKDLPNRIIRFKTKDWTKHLMCRFRGAPMKMYPAKAWKLLLAINLECIFYLTRGL